MKKMLLLLASTMLLLTARAKAQFNYGMKWEAFQDELGHMVSSDRNAPAQKYASAFDFKGDIPKDGPVTMTKDFNESHSDQDVGASGSSKWTTTSKATVSLSLVMKDGKVAGVVGTTQYTETTHTDSSDSWGKVTHNAVTTTSTYTFLQLSFDKSASKQVADIAKKQNPSGKKGPPSVPSETGGQTSTQTGQNVQQNVQTTVSPSAP